MAKKEGKEEQQCFFSVTILGRIRKDERGGTAKQSKAKQRKKGNDCSSPFKDEQWQRKKGKKGNNNNGKERRERGTAILL
jgi:hypothetical protein